MSIICDVQRVAGDQGAQRLIRRFGGKKIYIPKSMKPNHPIALAIGEAAARWLAAEYGGSYYEVPTGRVRNSAKLRIVVAQGSNAEVAEACGVSVRWVRIVRKMQREAETRGESVPDRGAPAPGGKETVN